jgi:hypothetical protein
MEDFWKLKEMGYRMDDLTDRAEYDLMVKRFREEEKSANMKNLLYGQQKIKQQEKKSDKD